jgi:cobalt-zinc-cadmium efflux system protein
MSDNHGDGLMPDGVMDRNLWISAALNVLITMAELVGGVLSGSLALLSDAAHNLSDVAAVTVALGARRLSRLPPTTRHTYGFKRAEVMAALGNAVVLIGVTVLIAREAILRLYHPEPVAQGVMLTVALVALVANLGSVLLLRRHEKDDVNVRSAFLHLAQDALASLAVVVAALLARTRVGPYVDPAAAVLVGLAVLRSALSLAMETLSTLLEGVPREIDLEMLAQSVEDNFEPFQLHHVHLWQNGPGQRLLTAHVTVDGNMTGRSIEALLTGIKGFLQEKWQVSHATLEPEVARCSDPSLLGRWEEPCCGPRPEGGIHPR